jgi:predicted kinase
VHTVGPDSHKLVLVMVGLPARGKSYTARRIERYLSWLGYRTRVFNVGQYRRARVGAQMPHDFFDSTNEKGEQARREVALQALDDTLEWLTSEGDVALYDATNSTPDRREMVKQHCEAQDVQVLFVERRP